MALYPVGKLEQEIRSVFPEETERMWHKTRGAMGLSISGEALVSMPVSELLAAIRGALPVDARILCMDGMVLRMRGGDMGYGADQFVLGVTSATFPLIEEGGSFPPMQPIFYGDKPFDPLKTEEPRMTHFHSIYPSTRDAHEFTINKTTHTLEIPRDRETEDRIVIVVRPKE